MFVSQSLRTAEGFDGEKKDLYGYCLSSNEDVDEEEAEARARC
jgi:hypothetical protein